MEPMKLKPAVKDYLWGGTRLREEYGVDAPLDKLAEAWMLSCHPQGEDLIENGRYQGLTLTQASHVIHVDRWWNPAVESQATDRAYRIGQHRNVLVHRLICRGTIEDRIDAMLTEKRRMADDLFSGGPEQWLMNMSPEELKKLLCQS